MAATPATVRAGTSARNKTELAGTVRAFRRPIQGSTFTTCTLTSGESAAGEDERQVIDRGVQVLFLGYWRDDPRWGMQFRFDSVTQVCPADKDGTISYLVKYARHVGQATARKLWDAYGADCVRKLREEFANVAMEGIMDVTEAHEAANDLQRLAGLERTQIELFGLLAGRRFSKHTRAKAVELWGVNAPERIRRNPFTMLVRQLPAAGFRRCDRLYLDLGNPPGRLKRQMLAGWQAVRDDQSGDTWSHGQVFRTGVIASLGTGDADVDRARALGLRAGWLRELEDSAGQRWFAETQKAANEKSLAGNILRLSATAGVTWPAPIDPDLVLSQLEGISAATSGPLGLLLGTPGTGKTRCAAALVRGIAQGMAISTIAVCAPTGKAAVRIQDAMNRAGLRITATTIHRLLKVGRNGHDGAGWGFFHGPDEPLPHRVVIVDESSMLDTDLANSLLSACATGTRVLFVGDPYQLPPVSNGCPLRDMIAANIPQGLLTEVKRNGGQALRVCDHVRRGDPPAWSAKMDVANGDNCYLVECNSATQVLDALRQAIGRLQAKPEFDPIWQCQVICPRNEESELSRKALNAMLQGLLNPLQGDPKFCQVGEFRLGDKIICLRNCQCETWENWSKTSPDDPGSWRRALGGNWQGSDHYIANGDQGRVMCLDPGRKSVIAEFSAPRRIVRVPCSRSKADDGEADTGHGSDFSLAYAITGHKSQGSEWDTVIAIADPAGARVASREWWYTVLSRMQRLVLVLGSARTVAHQCRRAALPARKTFLREYLAGEVPL